MLRLSRFILCALIVISFLYKSVCGSHQIENDDPKFIWKNNNSKDLVTLIDLFNLIHTDNYDDLSAHNHIQREPWIRSQRSALRHSRPKRSINETDDDDYYEIKYTPFGEMQDEHRMRKYILDRLRESKRNLEFTPRLGRAVHNDDCVEIVRFRPPYAPRLGKKSANNFSPRLGRQCPDFVDRRK